MAEDYRDNVAAIIINKEKKVLMCEHIWIDNAWQFPQGGVEDNESEEDAILRELSEEIGTQKLKILSKMDRKIMYKYPYYLKEKYNSQGQLQRYFLVYYFGDNSDIRFDNQEKPEFQSYQWLDYTEPPLRVIYFKKLAYLEALNYFKETVDKFKPEEINL